MSLIELIQDKKPGTNAQRIALFAYYREKFEQIARFGRDDLEAYFAKAHESPPSNYNRDFVEAVKKGWVHEDESDSYVTTKGIEAVENSFEGEMKRRSSSRRSKPPTKKAARKKSATKRATTKKGVAKKSTRKSVAKKSSTKSR
jgi:hypothetical protein